MAALAHLGVGLAAKRVNPKVPLYILIIAAWAIDIIWGIFFFVGVEGYPVKGQITPSPYSHGLFMSVIWSLLAGFITWLIGRDKKISIFIGLLVFSHWVVDIISHPMLAFFPDDLPLPLLFNGSPTVGFGLYSTQIGTNIGEYGTLLIGIILYILALRKLKAEKLQEDSFVSQ